LSDRKESERTLRVSLFGQPKLKEALEKLGESADTKPSRWTYIEVSARECRDRELDLRWSHESWEEVNFYVEGWTALVRMEAFLETLGSSRPTAPSRFLKEGPEVDPSKRLAKHYEQWKGKLLLCVRE
jgi:hypothetical protein